MKLPQKILGEKIAFAAQQLYTKIKFHVLWFRRRRAYKILEEKKGKKNLIAAKNRLVGTKKYLKTFNSMKYFFRT